jgi:hypothetical protein
MENVKIIKNYCNDIHKLRLRNRIGFRKEETSRLDTPLPTSFVKTEWDNTEMHFMTKLIRKYLVRLTGEETNLICVTEIKFSKANVKFRLCLTKHYAMKTYVQIHVLLTSALVGSEWSASRPGSFTLSGTHWTGGWIGLSSGLHDMEMLNILTIPGRELRPPRSSSP